MGNANSQMLNNLVQGSNCMYRAIPSQPCKPHMHTKAHSQVG